MEFFFNEFHTCLVPLVLLHKFLFGWSALSAEDFVAVRETAEAIDDILVIYRVLNHVLAPDFFEEPQRFFLDFPRFAVLKR